ncbi:MAG: haloacid dehalogenase-like hydrolase [Candidatus Aminicenantes bacterium]|nr:haloacid dehalogenase-like hydrolase [Candidatus Aminicenantes bacterium]MCK5005470.1 haloacid dehalogenase-like hydrolase [Candidatus Aminicenantes bacterium]
MKMLPGYFRKKNSPEVPAELSKKIKRLSCNGIKRAIFDLDNTILNGDIGDALFCRIKNLELRERVKTDGSLIDLTWDEYQSMISRGQKESAYKRVVECMKNVPVNLIADLTRELMNSDFRFLEHSGEKISIPHVDTGIRVLVSLLKKENYDINVISASNSISVKIVAEEYLGLQKSKVFGVESEFVEYEGGKLKLTGKLKEPVPVNNGKAELYHVAFGDELPLITAGDSELDFPMLDLVCEGGIVLWRGEEGSVFEKLRNLIGERAEVISLLKFGFGQGAAK